MAWAGLLSVRFVVLRLTESNEVEAVIHAIVIVGVLFLGFVTFTWAAEHDRHNPRDALRRGGKSRDDTDRT